ncbi:MAG TPA: hypothetical protein VGF36_06060 [Rhodopila sp.]
MKPSDLIDPSGIAADPPIQPAPRLSELAGRRVLLLDNGKLGVGAYAVIADALCSGLPDVTWAQVTINMLRVDDADVEGVVDSLIAAHLPDACILALADAGVTAHTALLSMVLERRGIPTVMLGTPLGAGLGRAMFRARAPGLEVVVLDIVRTDSQAKAVALIAAEVPRIRALLTSDRAPAEGELALPYPADAAPRWASVASDMASFQDWAEQAGMGDGLPLIPPTGAAVAAHLATVDSDPDALVYGPALTSGRMLRVRDVAANAVMAGCPPLSFPVVLAALRAMAKPGYRLSQAAITTHPSGNAIILSGVDPATYGLSSGAGCLGPGHRGNACVGRAVSLSVLHLFGARPGEADLTIFGSPAEFTYCAAEAHTGTPFPPLATELGDGRAGVFVLKAEAPRNILENLALTPEALSGAIAEASVSLCSNNSFIPGELLVFLNPEHAAVFAGAGWTRRDLADAIHNLARIARQRVSGRGVGPIRPRYMDALEQLPVTRSAGDVHIVVAGAAGPQSMVALPWGYSRGQWQAL